MKVLIIVSHYRLDSLTFELKNQVEKGLKETGHQVDTLDLYKLKFNPILEREDDPDWYGNEQHFSAEVVREQERLSKYEAVVFVFPLYWCSLPAMLKGYIDRVWNLGFAHGRNKTWNIQKCLWMPLVGSSSESFATRKLDSMVIHQFNHGIAGYCGIEDSRVKMFYQTITKNTKEINQKLIEEAYQEGLNFNTW